MAVHIRMFTTLVPLTKRQEPQFDIDWEDGLTVGQVVRAEGFSEADAEAIAAVVNGEQADFERALADGDAVEFIVNLQGGGEVWPDRLTVLRATPRLPIRTDDRLPIPRRPERRRAQG